MDYVKKRIVGIIVALIASYLLASHYVFQWYSIIILTYVIFGLIIGGNLLIHLLTKYRKRLSNLRFFMGVVIIIIFSLFPRYEQPIGYDECAYPPFTLIEESRMNYDELSESYYFESEEFSGLLSYNHYNINMYDLITNVSTEIHWENEIDTVTYYEGFVYFTGESPGTENEYSLYRYNVKTEFTEFVFGSIGYIEVHTFKDLLYVSFIEDGTRKSVFLDQYLNEIESVEFDYLTYRVDSFGNMDVVQKYNGIFLYRDNEFVGEFASPSGDYVMQNYIYYYKGNFYITADNKTSFNVTDVFDENANYLYTKDEYNSFYTNDYVLFSENYVINNHVVWRGKEFELWTSVVTDLDGNPVCDNITMFDIRIIYKNQTFYGLYNEAMYEIEEMNYSTPFTYEMPQHGFIYWGSTVVVILFVIRKKSLLFDY